MKIKIFTLLLITAFYFSSCRKEGGLLPVNQNKVGLSSVTSSAAAIKDTVLYNIVGSLRVQLAEDTINTDNILINFNANAKTTFVRNEDAPYFPGFGAVSLSSLSSDNIALAINAEPLTKESLAIALNVNAKADGIYHLNMLAIKSVPAIFDIWLKDNYKNDSLDFRHNPTYAFNLYTADTASYGSHRFSIVLRQNAALGVHLLSFTAANATGGTQVSWQTENESVYTSFSIERSTDQGKTYTALTTIVSTAAGTYGFVDKTPATGNNCYRLKMTDLNGVVSYSSISTVTI